MLLDILSWTAVLLTLTTSTTILISRDWRALLGALALQYLAAFWLVTRHLPLAMGSVKLIAGWMSVAVLGMTRINLTPVEDRDQDRFYPRGSAFRLLLMGIVILVSAGSAPRIEAAISGMGLPVIAAGLLLVGAGLAQLGVTNDLLRVTLALLSILAGFEILYAAVESAILVTGLLAAVNLGLGVVGSYLMTAGSVPLIAPEDEE
jgi:hypothetical protein